VDVIKSFLILLKDPNPVCLLVTQDDSKVNGQNIMVCS